MNQTISSSHKIAGEISPPGDKSISHRAALLNSIGKGSAKIRNFCEGDDRESMMGCLNLLGAEITEGKIDGEFIIEGNGLWGLSEPSEVLNAGNSGTTMRLVSGLLSAQKFYSVITGDDSLRFRPMKRITAPLNLMGAQVSGRQNNSFAPLTFNPSNLKGIEYSMPVASAQLKSCLLIASLYAQGETIINQPSDSRDHTERMLKSMGSNIQSEGLQIRISSSELNCVDVNIPCDTSGSAFWLVAACCHPNAKIKIKNVGMNPTRTGVIEVLKMMGANLVLTNESVQGGEPVADILASSSNLKGIEISGEIIPRVVDELPILALASCFAEGKTTIKNAEELRVKESDRISATVDSLKKMSASIEELPDGMEINGTGRLSGAIVDSHGDHRIAMTNGIAGLLADGETTIQNSEAANVSYPNFWKELSEIQKA